MTTLETVREAELFSGLGEDDCRALGALGRVREVAAGAALFRHGDPANELYVVRRGHVELTFPIVVKGEVKETRFQSLGPGRTVAWSALVPPHRLTLGARGSTEVELLAFERGALLALLERRPTAGHVVMRNLSRVVAARLAEVVALWVKEIQRNVSQTYR